MKRNKKVSGLLLVLAGSFLLAGCDSVEALPNNYDDPIVVDENGTKVDVYKNIMGVLYEDINSNKKDDVLSNFINIVAQDQFGTYSEIKELVGGTTKDSEKIKTFIAAHKAAYVHDKEMTVDGETLTEDEYLAKTYSTTTDAIQQMRLENFYESVKDKINETFYNEITSKSYNDSVGKFYEERLAMAHYGEMYDININASSWYEGYLTPELKKDDVSSFIHLDDGRYDDYIERKIIRTVYKDKLVEQYLLENNYSTIGRAYGRKVNIIKLSRDEKYKDLPASLLRAYSKNYIKANKDIDFETIANAWRGFHGLNADGTVIPLTSEETALLKEATGHDADTESINGVSHTYFKETQYGQLLERYKLAENGQNNRFPTDEETSAYSEFNGSQSHTIEEGLTIKLAELALSDYTTDGWYVKNGGLTDLPDKIRNRLFNINVSNELDKDKDTNTYVQKINGHYYLTPSISETSDDEKYIIYDDGSYYIVEVEEAVASSKLNIDGKDSYVSMKKGDNALFTEKIARELASTLGTKDAYINNTYASYIEQYSLEYHDSAIYDYFKEKYPELFE